MMTALMQRRREMMGGVQWDYEGYAQADGTIQARNLTNPNLIPPVSRKNKIILAWDSTGYDGDETRIALFIGTSPYTIIYQKDLVGTSGVMEVPVVHSNNQTVTVLLSRSWTDRNGPRFMGKYLKVRVINA